MRSILAKLIFLVATFFLLFLIIVYFLGPKKFEEPEEVSYQPQSTETQPTLAEMRVLEDEVLTPYKSYAKILEARGGTVLKSDEEWQGYFEQLSGGRSQQPPKIVDFSKEDLIIVSSGLKATGSYRVKVERVVLNEELITVYVKETEPGEKCEEEAGVTTPADFVAIEKTALPIEFNFYSEVKPCP